MNDWIEKIRERENGMTGERRNRVGKGMKRERRNDLEKARDGREKRLGGEETGESGNDRRGKRWEKEWTGVRKMEIIGERKRERMKRLKSEGSDWREKRRERGRESGETKKLLERKETGERRYERDNGSERE